MHLSSRGFLAGTVALAAVLSLSTAADADKHTPSKADVDHARAVTKQKAGDVAAIQARLALAHDRLDATAQKAEIAAEQYNGAVYQLGQARKASAKAKAAARTAAARVEKQRDGVVALVTQGSQAAGQFASVNALLGAGDPAAIMDRVSAVQSAADAMQATFDEYKAARALATAAQDKAEKAEKKQTRLTRDAATLRDSAAAAAVRAEQDAEQIAVERRRLIVELATAQKISVSLAGKRQNALEAIARAKAAKAAKAAAERQRAAEVKAAQEAAQQAAEQAAEDAAQNSGGGSNGGGSNGGGQPTSGSTTASAARAIAFARSQLGDPYQWAAAGPNSWDCSGLMMMAWRAGGVSLPHYSAAQYQQTRHIGSGDLRPGDLVFWGSSPGSIHHVAMYLGNGQIIHAPRTGSPVRIDSMYYWVPPDYFGRP